MKQGTFNLICLGITVAAGVGMFLLKYHVVAQEKELAKLRGQIVSDRRELHLLKADWATLTDPQHLREMLKATDLKPFHAKQIVRPDELEDRPVPQEKPRLENEDV